MAAKRKRKKGGRKLEFTIYIVGAAIVILAVLGLVKLITNLVKPHTTTPTASTASVSSSATDTTESKEESVPVSSQEASKPTSSEEESKPESSNDVSSQPVSSQEETSQESKPANEDSKPNGDYVTYTKSGVAELDEWYLLLVNPDHSISSDWKTDMTDIGGQQLDSRIVEAYYDMTSAAWEDGANLWCASGYRSYSTQSYLYDDELAEVKQYHPDLSQKEAEDKAASEVARPGTSEHQTGLAIDFNYTTEDFGYTTEGKWLKEHAHEYGFILRYDQGKQPLTKVIWEPWHYRFVGVKHATRMKELGYCLEEYVAHIQNGGK